MPLAGLAAVVGVHLPVDCRFELDGLGVPKMLPVEIGISRLESELPEKGSAFCVYLGEKSAAHALIVSDSSNWDGDPLLASFLQIVGRIPIPMKDQEGGDRIPVSGDQRDAFGPDAGLTRHVEAFPYTVNSWFHLQNLSVIEVETYYRETFVKNAPSGLGCNAECPPRG